MLQGPSCLLRVQQKLTGIFAYFSMLLFCGIDSSVFSSKVPLSNPQSYHGCASASDHVYENLRSLLQAARIVMLQFFLHPQRVCNKDKRDSSKVE